MRLVSKYHSQDPIHQPNLFYRALLKWRPLFRLVSLQMVWITSLYGLGSPWESEQVRVVCRFCVVLTISRYFSLSPLSDNTPFSHVRIRGDWGFAHHHFFLCLSLDIILLFSSNSPPMQLPHFLMCFHFILFTFFLCTSFTLFPFYLDKTVMLAIFILTDCTI